MLQLQKTQSDEVSSGVSVAEQLQCLKVESKLQNNYQNLRFFRRAFGITLLLTFGVVYLQGFGIFHLPDGIIYSLCTATVGQLAGLFVLALRKN
jgi:hypothetical protein